MLGTNSQQNNGKHAKNNKSRDSVPTKTMEDASEDESGESSNSDSDSDEDIVLAEGAGRFGA